MINETTETFRWCLEKSCLGFSEKLHFSEKINYFSLYLGPLMASEMTT